MKNAFDVANFFLKIVDRSSGESISPLKLQKLLYYAQAWSLVLRNKPIFSEEIEAWKHGPVVRKVWEEFRKYRYNTLPEPDVEVTMFDATEVEVMQEVWRVYGNLSARHLEALTHREDPWLNSRYGLGLHEKSSNIISLEDMQNYYKNYLDDN
jgi:uncharacterized phage-associated protein